jgi:nucleoside-diphosphate-sugar epimerase
MPFTEETWTDPTSPKPSPYVKSKALAEKAAGGFIKTEGGTHELSVINPTAIYGPILGPHYASSFSIIDRALNGGIPACPNLTFGVVDVRDVAALHINTMTHPDAKGERFLCVSSPGIKRGLG